MRSALSCGAVLALMIATSGEAQVQQVSGGRAPTGGRTLVALSFAGTPVGDFPAGIEPNSGNLEVVDKNGQRMLRATSESSFLVTLPELMPQDFLLEFDLVPKSGHGGYDFSVEGTKEVDQGSQSIHLLWHSTNVRGVGGGGTGGFDAPMPEAVRVGLAGAPTTVAVSVTNQRIQFFANGTLTHTLPNRRFARSRILRVSLGGENEEDGAVYLSRFRVAAMGAATNVASNQSAMTAPNGSQSGGGGNVGPGSGSSAPGGSGSGTGASNSLQPNGIANLTVTDSPAGPVVNWLGVPGATYLVQRWLVADPACCAGTSPANPPLTTPPWQDTPLPVSGTYVYSVTATTSTGFRNSQVQFSYASAAASGRAMPTSTTAPSFSTPATSSATTPTTSVQVPASPGAISSGPIVAPPTTTTTTTTATALPAAQPAVTIAALPTTTIASTNPAPAGGASGSGGSGSLSGGAAGSTGGASGGSNVFPTGPGSNSGAVTGRYRVTLSGARAYTPTLEVQTGPDGAGDEVYASAAVMVWNRTTQTGQSLGTFRTLEYGEVPNAQLYPNRIQVGTVTAYGGIRGTELIPQQFDPMGTTIPPVTTDRFPLLLWEGTLTDVVDAVLVVPALWDRDIDPTLYNMWRSAWQNPSLPQLFAKPELQLLLSQNILTAPALTIGPSAIAVPPPELTLSVKDHPIGLTPKPTGGPPALADYQDRYLVITRERLTMLQGPGTFLTFPVSLVEPQSLITRASYVLYVRIERIP